MASRDMTEAQFKAALKRNGFAPAGFGLWFRDTTGEVAPHQILGGVWDRKKGELARRATIAHLIAGRKRIAKQLAALTLTAGE